MKKVVAKKPELTIMPFASAKAFENWLKKHHNTSPGIWMQFYKKASGVKTIVYKEAVEVSLCYGWIDSQAKSLDEKSYLQRFTPRGKKSIWSKINRDHVARLIKEKRMTEFGLAHVEAAKQDGRWDQAYDSPKTMTIPEDFMKLVNNSPKALAFFKTLSKTNLYAISWRIQTAKKLETRIKRMNTLLEMLEREETFH